MSIDELVAELCKVLDTMTDTERSNFFYDVIEKLTDGYCQYCGVKTDHFCHCRNDD